MKIRKNSYEIHISPSKKLLINIGGCVNIFEMDGDEFKEFRCFNQLKNLDYSAISNNEKLIAYKNTSGHIVVQEIETEEILIKNKKIPIEGGRLYFIDNDKAIISSNWNGEVFTIDMLTGNAEIVFDLPISTMDMLPIEEGKFIAFGSQNIDEKLHSEVFILSIKDKKIVNRYSFPKFSLEEPQAFLRDNEVYFYSEINHENKKLVVALNVLNGKLETFLDASEVILGENEQENPVFKIKDKKVAEIYEMLIQQINEAFDQSPEMKKNFDEVFDNADKDNDIALRGYMTCMCMSQNKKILIIGFSDSVYVYDAITKKIIGMKKMKYVSSVNFLLDDSKVIIGTWTNIHIIDFCDLLFPKKN